MEKSSMQNDGTQEVEFIPHAGQRRIFDSNARFIFAMGGKRGGKTTAGCYWAEMQSETPGSVGLIGAPTFDQLTQSTLVKFFTIFPQLEKYYYKKTKMIGLPNGSKIYLRSLDMPRYLEGLNLNWAFVDEGDGLNYPTWTILRGRVATTHGRILICSTIYPDSWIYDYIYKADSEPGMVDIITWESIQNPSFPQDEWKSLQKELDPTIFDREYRSKFIWSQGNVYGTFSTEDVLPSIPGDVKVLKTFVGLDFGYLDPSAILVMCFCSDNKWYIVDEMYKSGMDIDQINHWLGYYKSKYGFSYCFADPQSAIAKNSLTPSFNVIDANKEREQGITTVRNLIYQHRLKILEKCYNVIREIKSYSYQRGGGFLKEVPEEKNDHAMDAMRYVLHTAGNFVTGLQARYQSLDENAPEETEFWKRRQDPEYKQKIEDRFLEEDLIY